VQRGRTIAAAVLAAVGLTTCTSGHGTRTTSSSHLPSMSATSRSIHSASSPASDTALGRPSHAAPPDRIITGPTLAGCPLFPPTNPWRRDISHDPVSGYSAAWVVASVGAAAFLHPDFGSNPSYGFPYSVVPVGQRKVPVRFTAYGSESDPGPYPIPSTAKIEASSDHHVLVASGDCHLYELFGAVRSGSGWSAAAGAVFNLRSNALRPAGWTSADAAGLPILPGLVRHDEVESGHIDHALRFTVAQTQRGYISPATHQAGSTSSLNVPWARGSGSRRRSTCPASTVPPG
jgi:hypothetical protein